MSGPVLYLVVWDGHCLIKIEEMEVTVKVLPVTLQRVCIIQKVGN